MVIHGLLTASFQIKTNPRNIRIDSISNFNTSTSSPIAQRKHKYNNNLLLRGLAELPS